MTLNVKRKSLCESGLCTLLVLFLVILAHNSIYAEGTKELAPNESDRVYLYLNGELYNSFGRYDGNADQRLFFHIENPDQEQVFLGFSQSVSSGHYPCSGANNIAYFRIKSPDGTIVYPTPNDLDGQILDAFTANINSRAEAIAGPSPIVGVNGYDPFVFDPSGLPAGDYYIEFSAFSSIAAPNIITAIENWDITVASKDPTPLAKPGRVFATNWAFYAPSIECDPNTTYGWFDRPFNGQFYVYSKEGFVNLVDFHDSGFQPAAFNMYFNELGASNTNILSEDRKSAVGLGSTLAEHKIFLNDPDIQIYPSGEYGTLSIAPELHICGDIEACILVEPTKPGQIEILIDIDKTGGDFVYTPNSKDVLLVFDIEPETNEEAPFSRCIPWDRKDGLGNIVFNEVDLGILVTYQQGIYHIPFYDVEYLLNGVQTTNIRPLPASGNFANKLYYDDSNIPFLAGNNTNQIELNGCEAPCHAWSNKDFGNRNTINTWFFADETSQLKNKIPNCLIEALPDEATTPFQTPISIEVLANDIGSILDTSSLEITSPSPNGSTISINDDGQVTYQPAINFSGLDSFRYKVCYDILPINALCDMATVYVNVNTSTEINCEDGIDNDGDGFIDCDDSDCLPLAPPSIRRKGK